MYHLSKVVWKQNGGKIKRNFLIETQDEDEDKDKDHISTLVTEAIKVENTGDYSITISNGEGDVSVTFNIDVQG